MLTSYKDGLVTIAVEGAFDGLDYVLAHDGIIISPSPGESSPLGSTAATRTPRMGW